MFSIAEDILGKINCVGVGRWLEDLATKLGVDLPGQNLQHGHFHTIKSARGLILTFGRTDQPVSDDKDALYLHRVVGDALAPMPFRLNPAEETLATAMAKLSSDYVGGEETERRVSFFLDEGKVIELRFNQGMIGFDRILIACLGGPRMWGHNNDRLNN